MGRPTTIREELTKLGFAWDGPTCFVAAPQLPGEDWATKDSCRLEARALPLSDPLLDERWDAWAYGMGPDCPSFIAQDERAVYFPVQYDGSVTICRVLRNVQEYVGRSDGLELPYPGG